jgi:hypothetical protein
VIADTLTYFTTTTTYAARLFTVLTVWLLVLYPEQHEVSGRTMGAFHLVLEEAEALSLRKHFMPLESSDLADVGDVEGSSQRTCDRGLLRHHNKKSMSNGNCE